MFLDNLSKDEKEAFICIAHKVMLSNEIIDDDQSKAECRFSQKARG